MISKVRNRSREELQDRLSQFAWNRLDRLGLVRAPIGDDTEATPPRTPWPAIDAEAIRARISDAERDALLARADRLLADRFDVLGLEGLSYGSPVNWQLDPLSQKSAALVPWTQVPYLDASVVGDHKLIWEINRHQWFPTLAQAWVLTGDARYTAHAAALLHRWLQENPPKRGINWCSALELAFRVQSWIHGLHIAQGAPSIDAPLRAALRASAAIHCQHIEHNLSKWFSPNTHLTGEALALLAVGTAWPTLPRAAAWRAQGWAILGQQLPRQVRPDGVYFEQSTWYQSYTVDFYLLALQWSGLSGFTSTPEMQARIAAAAQALRAVTRSDGTVPLLGDDDGGCTLPLRVRRPGDVSDTLWRAAAALDARLRPVCDAGASALLWLEGPTVYDRITDTSAPDAKPTSCAMRDGGWIVLREPASTGEHLLLFDAGPHGTPPHGHSHADALSIDLTVGGVPMLVDPGTGAYVGAPRTYFRSTAVHNTVTVDDRDSSEQAGSFKWTTAAATTLLAYGATADATWAMASHDGYGRLPDPVRHTRMLVRLARRYWVVLDVLDAVATHRLALTFQLAEGVAALPQPGGYLLQTGGAALRVGYDPRVAVAIEARQVSPAYADVREASALVARMTTDGSVGLCTVLGVEEEVGAVRVSAGSTAWSWSVETRDGLDQVALPRGERVQLGPASFDGSLLMVVGPESAMQVIVAGAGRLEVGALTVQVEADDIRVARRAADGSWLMEN